MHRAACSQAAGVRLYFAYGEFHHRAPIVLPLDLADTMLRRGGQATSKGDNLLPVTKLVPEFILGQMVEVKRLVGQANPKQHRQQRERSGSFQ